jgi:hypothetical protein
MMRPVAGAAWPRKLLHSFHETARLLGWDRGSTLRDAIASGQIRTVLGPKGKRYVSGEELQRIQRDGLQTTSRPRRHRRTETKPPDTGTAARIRAIKLRG